MHSKYRSWILISVLLAAFTAAAHAQIVTTTVADTIYHADGTAATGTALISWPAFTTSNGDVIPPGSTSAVITVTGALSVQLTPNAGATPIGSYYTVVYHLDDGSVNRQYWVVPVSTSQVKVSAVESAVLPISVAMQTVSKSYVDTAIAAAVTGHPLDSNPFTLKSGDTMTGPLILPADPVSANQAADKNYVDQSVAASASAGTQKISLGGDLGGIATAPVVIGIQGSPVAATVPAIGQTLTWNGSAYVPATPNDDDLASPPAIGDVTAAPYLNVFAYNTPNSAWDTYSGIDMGCAQTLFPGDNGSPYPAGFCINTGFNDWYPGEDYGSPGDLSNGGWYMPYAFGLNVDSKSAGIRIAQQVVATYTGPGDTVVLNLTGNSKEAVISGSTEGLHMFRQQLTELGDYGGTVATGGTGATTLTLKIGSNGGSLGLNSPLIDLNSRTSCTLSNIRAQALTGTYGTLAAATTSCTLTVSDAGTLASAADVPRIAANTTGQLTYSARTVTLNTTTDLSLLPSPIVCSIVGPTFYETIGNSNGVPIAFGTYNSSAHTQTVTANFYYSHTAGAPFFCGGAAGTYFDQTADDPGDGDNIYLLRIYGSTGPNSIWVSSETSGGFRADYVKGGAGNIYQGGDVVGVLDPATSSPDGTYVAIMANTASWTPPVGVTLGDSVENTNNISANYYNDYYNSNVNNPFVTRVVHQDTLFGYGGGLNTNAWAYLNNAQPGNYQGLTGGVFQAPTLIYAKGAWANGIAMQYAPLFDGGNIGDAGANCAGYLLCIGQGPAPGATSTLEGLFSQGDDGSSLTYDHATGIFNLKSYNGGGGGFNYNGSRVCTLGNPCVSAMASDGTQDWKSNSLKTNVVSGLGSSCANCSSLTLQGDNYPSDSSYAQIQIWGYCDPCGSSPTGDVYLKGFAASSGLLLDSDIGGHSGGAGWGYTPTAILPAGFSVAAGQPFSVGCTNATTCAGSIDGSGNATLPSVNAAVYLGPTAAPTGTCPSNGAWVFSQDGHATFCADGTWTAKI